MAEIKSHKELSALISMIDEPNEVVYNAIRQKIVDYGKPALPVLEDAWMNSFSEEQNERLEGLIGDIRFRELYSELQKWKQFNQDDLLAAFVLMSRFRYPDFDEEKYLAQLARLKQDAWLEMNEDLTALEKTKVLNHILYDVWKFRSLPSRQSADMTNAYFLNEVLDKKNGNALSLGIIYIWLARSLNIPVFGVDTSQHFMLAYLDDTFPIKAAGKYTKEDVLFYISSWNKGAVFTTNDVDHYIEKMELEAQDMYYLPCDNLMIIRRLIAELIMAYQSENEAERVSKLEDLLLMLDA